MQRSHFEKSGDEIRALIHQHWDDFWQLGVLAYELQFREKIEEEQRAAVVERLVELGVQLGKTLSDEPGFEFPSTDIVQNRRLAVEGLGEVDWRQYGLLSLSGYRVGITNGRKDVDRRRILNWLFLEDDLRDIGDEKYAVQWGEPKTSSRLEKLANTIAAFVRNAKRRDDNNMEVAIQEWTEDLNYLRARFYERWGDFPWPNVAVIEPTESG